MHGNAQLARRLDDLALPSGRFAMVAIDQRESLRAMFHSAGGVGDDEQLTGFKAAAAEVLGVHSSAVLVDPGLGLPAACAVARTDNCALILAADVLEYDEEGAVGATRLDDEVLGSSAPVLRGRRRASTARAEASLALGPGRARGCRETGLGLRDAVPRGWVRRPSRGEGARSNDQCLRADDGAGRSCRAARRLSARRL